MNNLLRTAAFLAALGCFSLLACAGVVIKRESGEPGAQQKQKSTMYVEAGKIRMEMESEHGKTIMIFDGNKQVLWMIQPDQGMALFDQALGRSEAQLVIAPLDLKEAGGVRHHSAATARAVLRSAARSSRALR